MVDTLVPPDQDIDPSLAALSKRARVWLLVVACLGVSLIISSMVALNAALPDLARETTGLACMLLPAGAIGDRYGLLINPNTTASMTVAIGAAAASAASPASRTTTTSGVVSLVFSTGSGWPPPGPTPLRR